MEVDAKVFWRQLEGTKVDLIFEQVQKVLLSLKQKIKDGTATNEEYFQALALVDQVGMADPLPLTNVNVAEEDIQIRKPGLHPSASSEIKENPGDNFSLRMEIHEGMHSSSEEELTKMPSKFRYHGHVCSKECLAKMPWNSYKGENPLNLPILCRFQRLNAKKDSASKSHDVIYKAPCGRSLRSFQEVQNYLFQTECSFLFLDHFSFNTYVQVFRNSPSRQALVYDYDISKGAETTPVSFCNDIDYDELPYFKYRKTSWPRGYFLNNFSNTFLESCGCTDGCTDRTKCACLILTERSCCEASVSSRKETPNGYSHKRLDGPIPSGIYECSLLCSCDKIMCQNRLVQHGLQVRLQVFNTEKKGWGVRCLDDIDKGTFVCTYAGRLMSRNESLQAKDGDGDEEENTEEENTENSDRSHTLFSRKRKLDIVCSDSNTELMQTTGRIQNYSYNRSWNNQVIARQKTRTYILQSRRRQLGISDASSDEAESSVCEKSGRRTTAAKKGDEKSSLQGKLGERVSTVLSEAHPLSNAALSNKTPAQDDRWIKKPCKELLWTDDTHKGKTGRGRQQPAPTEAATEDENPCLFDATREGNVGRFFNHSCSPNLFVQSVFVETHNRNFPWVSFFTNRHVKAGTELTWDYGYEAGSVPEAETTCQCGTQKCRKKIL